MNLIQIDSTVYSRYLNLADGNPTKAQKIMAIVLSQAISSSEGDAMTDESLREDAAIVV